MLYFVFNSIECFASENFRERIYLQTDKHLYLAGEPILIKLVTTDTELVPTAFSRIAYVELVRDSIAELQIMVELRNGVGTGQMILPANIPSGYYRLIAYTQFMRNEGSRVFFERNIAILNPFLMDYHPTETAEKTPQSAENQSFIISVQSDQTAYATRERGELVIVDLPENMHTLSVSIAGKEWLSIAASSATLFQRNQTKRPAEFSDMFLPELEGHIITGRLVGNGNGEPSSDLLPALSFPGEGINFFTGRVIDNGDVRFITTGNLGNSTVATTVFHSDGNSRVDIQSPFITQFSPTKMPVLHLDSAFYEQLLERSVALQLFRFFSDNPLENQATSEPFLQITPTETYLLSEFTRFTTMREIFTEFIIGARFRRRADNWEMSVLRRTDRDGYEFGNLPLVLFDGIPVSDHNLIFNYDPLLVERVCVFYGPLAFGGHVFDGIINFTTYRRQHEGLNFTGSLQIWSYTGPQMPVRFFAPNYSTDKQRNSRIPDGRHTLLWHPNVRTNGKNSVRLPFYTSDLTGEFQITVEGITTDGTFVHATSSFTVSDD